MTRFDEALKPYTDEDGLILERPNSSPGPDTGNGTMNLCVAEIVRFIRGESSTENTLRVKEILETCEVLGYPGLFERGPRKTDLDSHDNRRAIAALSNILNLPFATDIVFHGKTNWWSYNNVDPGVWSFRSWDGRMPGLVATYKLAARLDIGFIDRSEIAGTLYYGARSSDPHSRLLDWFTILVVKRSLCFGAHDAWWEGLFKSFPRGMKDVLEAVYGKDHPIAVYAPESTL